MIFGAKTFSGINGNKEGNNDYGWKDKNILTT